MTADIKNNMETKMDQSIAAFKNNLATIRTGRPSPAILDSIHVDYYGSMVPLSQVANVQLLDARTLSVQPWEKGMGAKIEKAIRESDLGLNPASMGDIIRVPMPPMSEERRKEMTKLARNEGESAKIAVRNLRRDANEAVKKSVKDKLASEDDQKRAEADIQKVTDRHIIAIDALVAAKEHDIMAVLGLRPCSPLPPPHLVCRTTLPSSWMAMVAGPNAAFCRAWPAINRVSLRCAAAPWRASGVVWRC